jgi:hypothetical protein
MAAGMLVLAPEGRSGAAYIDGQDTVRGGGERIMPPVPPKDGQVPEVRAMLGNLIVDAPHKHKNMLVFPIRYKGALAAGDWNTLDEATGAGRLKVLEKDQASVPEVQLQNVGDRNILIVSGEIIAGGKQTRVARKDVVLEPKQHVALAVFCVEQRRWAGDKEFKGSGNMAPMSIQNSLKTGVDQSEVWRQARDSNAGNSAAPASESLDEGLNSPKAMERKADAHKDLGRFSPPDTIGIAIADARTGRVVGLELFGQRALFEKLEDKLVEGYAMDLVPAGTTWKDGDGQRVTEKDVEAFIARALDGTSRYEETPGSGRGIDLTSGTLRGKGVAEGNVIIHLSVQDVRSGVQPVRPIVRDGPMIR